MPLHRSLRSGSRGLLFALICGNFTACNQLPPGPNEPRGLDVLDRIRSLDLLPRPPQQADSGNQNAGVPTKPVVYQGTIGPAIEGTRSQPAATGEGYDLNFENTPIAMVA